MLHFRFQRSEEGWTAQCREVKGIITGNTNPNPSQEEIISHIRDAVRAAFNFPAHSSQISLPVESVFTIEALGLTKQYAR